MREADFVSVFEIQSECYSEFMQESLHSLKAKLVASPETCFVAEGGEAVVAYLISLPWSRYSVPERDAPRCLLPTTADSLYLHDLSVSPLARGCGVGAALTEHFLEVLYNLSLPVATLIAVQDSADFWRRFGFREVPIGPELRQTLTTYGANVGYMERPA